MALVEPQAPRPVPADESWDNRVYALSPGNVQWLGEIGIWRELPAARVTHVEACRSWRSAEGRLEFSAYESGLRALAWIVENRLVQGALGRALESAAHVRLFCPAQCEAIEWEREWATLRLAGGEALRARLIVGADGADSWVRERAGIGVAVHDYGQVGIVANFGTRNPTPARLSSGFAPTATGFAAAARAACVDGLVGPGAPCPRAASIPGGRARS